MKIIMRKWIIHPIYNCPVEVDVCENRFSTTGLYATDNKEFGKPINKTDIFDTEEECFNSINYINNK